MRAQIGMLLENWDALDEAFDSPGNRVELINHPLGRFFIQALDKSLLLSLAVIQAHRALLNEIPKRSNFNPAVGANGQIILDGELSLRRIFVAEGHNLATNLIEQIPAVFR